MKKNAIAFLCFVLIPFFVNAQTVPQKIDELISKYSQLRLFNGSALVADNGKVIFEKGYGYADMEWDIPNDPQTKFRLGSITKQFTSMLIMQQVEKGNIKLDGKITDYLPYYRKDTGDKVTIHQLLTHTSGIPSYTNDPKFFSEVSRTYYKPDDFIKKYCSGDLEFEPGSQFSYDNSGYFILGAILEHVTGIPYDKLLQKNIFEPLGMKNSGYDWTEKIIPHRASGYEKNFGGYRNTDFIDMSLPYAAGSLYSTVEDLFIWDKAKFSPKLLQKKYWDMIFTKYIKAIGNSYYGYGWMIDSYANDNDTMKVITHGGGINGFNTINYTIPSKGQMVILLNNTGGAPLNEITNQILNILYGKPTQDPKKSLVEYLYNRINKDGIDPALAAFNKLKDDKDNYTYSEREINNLGYELLNKDENEEAAAVFKLNVDLFPESFNVYDSYGEALLKMGDKEGAIKNYKKSVEINPHNTGGIEKLKELGVEIEAAEDVKVSQEVLNSYVGKYQLAPNFILTVSVEGDKIFTQATGQPKIEIFPESENVFYLKVVQAKIEFKKNDKGSIESLILHQNGRDMPANKIE